MVMSVRMAGRISWNSPNGLPERIVEAPQSSLLTDVAPPVRRADVVVRADPDGVAQLSVPSGGGTVRLVRLGSPAIAVDVPADDAVPSPDGRVLRPDGRVAVVRYDEARPGRDVVSIDVHSGEETVVQASDEAFGFLACLIGVDKTGRAYGFSGGELGCVEPDGSVAWKIRPRGAAVSGDDLTILVGDQLLRSDGKPVHTTADQSVLIGQSDDGYVLYRREPGPGYGSLLHLDTQGTVTGTEPASADVWVTGTDLRPPGIGSVTPDGKVLMAALSPEGVTVVAFTG